MAIHLYFYSNTRLEKLASRAATLREAGQVHTSAEHNHAVDVRKILHAPDYGYNGIPLFLRRLPSDLAELFKGKHRVYTSGSVMYEHAILADESVGQFMFMNQIWMTNEQRNIVAELNTISPTARLSTDKVRLAKKLLKEAYVKRVGEYNQAQGFDNFKRGFELVESSVIDSYVNIQKKNNSPRPILDDSNAGIPYVILYPPQPIPVHALTPVSFR